MSAISSRNDKQSTVVRRGSSTDDGQLLQLPFEKEKEAILSTTTTTTRTATGASLTATRDCGAPQDRAFFAFGDSFADTGRDLQELFMTLAESPQLVESTSASMSKSNSFMGSKRRRGPEDEAYLDNYHTHKRYLTEVMASSMNGLSVNDSVISRRPLSPLVDPMLSSAPTETLCTLSRSASSFPSQGDETSTLDSLMSEDSDESVGYRFSRGSEALQYPASFSSDLASSHLPSACSPSPRRSQRLPCHGSGQLLPGSLTWMSSSRVPATPYTPPWLRIPDTEGRLPPSPNDPSQAPDLRRATLLRNLSMRAQLPTQPTSSSTALDNEVDKNSPEQESGEEDGGQSSLNSMSCHLYEYAPEQVACNTSIMGSPTHGVFPSHVVRGSPRVRSLVLGESTIGPKALLATGISTSSKGDKVMVKLDQPSTFEEEASYSRSTRSPRSPCSPRSPNAAASSSGYEILSSLSPKDGNVSDTESSFSRRRSARTSLYAR